MQINYKNAAGKRNFGQFGNHFLVYLALYFYHSIRI